jgi:hypothetical protein
VPVDASVQDNGADANDFHEPVIESKLSEPAWTPPPAPQSEPPKPVVTTQPEAPAGPPRKGWWQRAFNRD